MFGTLYEWRLRLQREAAIFSAKRLQQKMKSGGEIARPARKKNDTVKGVSRRVVIVRAPDPRIFEEAIFVVNEEFMNGGVSAAELLREAEKAADDYIETTLGCPPRRPVPWLRTAACIAAGAAVTALLGFALHFFAAI
jgi:hypothetical protein